MSKSHIPANKTPQPILDQMVELYLDGMPRSRIVAMFGKTDTVLRRELDKRNIPRRPPLEANRRYVVNHHFFDVIDTEEKAYWLGFITTDGCVFKKVVRISLSSKDRQHLEKWNKSIDSNYPIVITEVEGTGLVKGKSIFASVAITSEPMVAALKRLGVTERKTFTVSPPKELPEYLWTHYWRGVIDGDGCISRRKPKTNKHTPQWAVGLCGNKFMVGGFVNYVNGLGVSNATASPKNTIWSVSYHGTIVSRTIISHLYKEAMVYLDRKKRLADEIMLLETQQSKPLLISQKEAILAHQQFGTMKDATVHLGTTFGKFRYLLDGRRRKKIENWGISPVVIPLQDIGLKRI